MFSFRFWGVGLGFRGCRWGVYLLKCPPSPGSEDRYQGQRMHMHMTVLSLGADGVEARSSMRPADSKACFLMRV
jgi:hypothetical protein